MRIQFVRRIRTAAIASAFATSCIALPSVVMAQDAATEEAAEEKTEETAEEEEVVDPFAVPSEASAKELIKFMDSVMRTPPPKGMSRTDLAKKVFPAIIEAADVVVGREDAAEQHVAAITRKLSAYGILVRYDSSIKDKAAAFIEECANDERDEIAELGVSQLLTQKASTLGSKDKDAAIALINDTLAMVERFGMTRSTYSASSSIARGLGRGKTTAVAADLYNKLADLAETSEEESIKGRAVSLRGAARRMNLMGSPMEVFGKTATGEEFDIANYKGKVVLVDFWASWCGPCIGELPNMKRNLKNYGEKGFEIVGINMDSTVDRFEKCIDEKEITWTNIVSWDEGKAGWAAPMATHYGISGIPTAILLDKEGNVVSLNARGDKLDEKLKALLGPIRSPVSVDADLADEEDEEAESDDK